MVTNLKISDRCQQPFPKGCAVAFSEVRKCVANPSQNHQLQLGGRTVELFQNEKLIVFVNHSTPPEAVFALQIFPDLCEESFDELTPLKLVEKLVEKFGFEIHISNTMGICVTKGKFLFDKTISVPPGGNMSFHFCSDCDNPPQGSPLMYLSIRTLTDATHVGFGFSLDVSRYENWIKSH